MVELRTVLGAIKSLGVRISGDAAIGAVFGMVMEIFHHRDAWVN